MREKIVKLLNKVEKIIEKHYRFFFWLIFILAFLLNTYKLGQIPSGVDCDEAGMTYDAWCIANYGCDRFLNKFPVYLINFGDGQSVLYAYMAAIIIKIFGNYNLLLVRIPALILSMIEVVVSYLLVSKFRSKKESLLFMFLITISPWHIMKSRWGLDAFLFSPLQLIALYTLINAILAKNKKIVKYFIAGSMFGITLYTYAISYIVVPIFLVLMLIYLIKLKKIKLGEAISFTIPLMVFATPLIMVQLVQKEIIQPIHSFITIPKLFKYRINELDITKIWENLKTIRFGLWCDKLNFNSLKGFGELYYIGTFLMCVGLILEIYGLIRNKNQRNNNKINLDLIMLMSFICNLIITFLTDIDANKMNGIYVSATYMEFVALGKMHKNIKPVFYIFLILYIISFWLFLREYFVKTKDDYKVYWSNGTEEAFEWIENESDLKNRQIYGDQILYIYKIYANPISPYEFADNVEFEKNKVIGYSNYKNIIVNVQDIDENAVYLTHNAGKASYLVKNKNLKMKKFDWCYVLYK